VYWWRELHPIQKILGSILAGDPFKFRASSEILMGRRFDPWKDNFKNFTILRYKCNLDKSNVEFWKEHLSSNSRISILHKQISKVYMCAEPGPASQDAVIKSTYASPGLQWSQIQLFFYKIPRLSTPLYRTLTRWVLT
jgi:hypothetical protein